jgi:predicted RNA-binding protein with PIN domain
VPWLIDGHNLIGYLPDISLEDPDDEQQLVMRLQRYRAHTRQPITVVFDHSASSGAAPGLSGGGVKVIFARAGHSADALILQQLQDASDPRLWTVVTGDRELAAQARGLGARVLSPAEFAPRLTPRARTPSHGARDEKGEAAEKPTRVDDVEEWLDLFRAWHRPREEKKR